MSEPAYRIQVAAQISGVSEPLIRAWERRYGVLKPRRTPGGYRTYSDSDIQVLKKLKELTGQGLSIAQAAPLVPGIRRDVRDRKSIRAPREAQVQRWRDEVLLGAQKLDQLAVDQTLEEAFRSMSHDAFYEELVGPLMREVGERWSAGTLSVAEEHLISFVAREKVLSLLARAPRRSKQHLLAACASDEGHEFGLLGAAVRFRQAGWRVTVLGAKTPVEQLALAVRTSQPDLVGISIIRSTGARDYLEALAAALPANTSVVLGGQGLKEVSELARKHRFRMVQSEADWKRVLAHR